MTNQFGFTLQAQQAVAETATAASVFRHDITGATVAFLENDNDNQGFVIAFRTPPSNDTGVAHILEHSVLNGSARYPVKEPFSELLRSSLNTFLNAFTYSDRTAYPVASRNEQDFTNLVSVYLDAVFAPLLSHETFMQEGWHHTLEEGKLGVSGIVYNEMIGSYSSPDNVLWHEVYQALYPDSIYAHSSGGRPETIPDLSYEEFLSFHRSYYTPSNSITVIAGKVDVSARLKQLHNYFSRFAKSALAPVPAIPPVKTPVSRVTPYPIGPGEDCSGRTYVLRSWATGQLSPQEVLAWTVLSHILIGTPGAPLRKALIESGLGQETLHWGLDTDVSLPSFSIGLKGTEADRQQAIEACIGECLQALVRDGLPEQAVTAALNSTEFRLREANYGSFPATLHDALLVVGSWTYDQPLLAYLQYEAPLAALRQDIAAGPFFESMIRTKLLENPHHSTVVLRPETELAEEQRASQQAKLMALQAKLEPTTIAEIQANVDQLAACQGKVDAPEALATIPVLPRTAIRRQADQIPFTMISEDDLKLSFSERPTRGITYLKARFSADAVPAHLFPYLGIFGKLCLETGTQSLDYAALMTEICIHTGGIGASSATTSRLKDPDALLPALTFTGKALTSSVPRLIQLLRTIWSEARLDDIKRLTEIVGAVTTNLRTAVVTSGHQYASCRLSAHHSTAGSQTEVLRGLEQFVFLRTLSERLATDPLGVASELQELRQILLRTSALHLHVTGEASDLQAVQAHLGEIRSALPNDVLLVQHWERPFASNEAWVIPADVQYVAQGLNLYDHGLPQHGAFSVLSHLIDQNYLWNEVRVKGNAYGCFSQFDLISGQFTCVSYRDPHLAETLRVYAALPEFIRKLDLTDSEYDRDLIGTMGSIDAPRTADQDGSLAFRRYLTGIDQQLIQRRRDEILGSTPSSLRQFADALAAFAEHGTRCVFGGQAAIAANAERFSAVAHAL